MDTPFLRIAHRGNSAGYPENTMPAFDSAFSDFNCDMIEFDIHTSRDGIPLAIHDARLERTTNGTGYVGQHFFSDLKDLDAGYNFDPETGGRFPFRGKGIRIPTVEEILTCFPKRSFAIELKEASVSVTHSVMNLVRQAGAMERTIIGSKHDIVARTLREYYPGIRRFCSMRDIFRLWIRFHLGVKGSWDDARVVASLPPRRNLISFDHSAWVDFLHGLGIPVYFWDVENPEAVQKLAALKADGLIVSDPSLLERFRSPGGIAPKGG